MAKDTSGIDESHSDTNTPIVATGGEILPNGSVLEPVTTGNGKNLQLLHWSGERVTIAPQIEDDGHVYRPAKLDPSIRKVMPFPGPAVEYGEPRTFFQRVADLFQRYIGLDESDAKLLALWVLSTWFSDCFATPSVLLVSSIDTGHAIRLFRLLRCLCRHPLMLADISGNSLLRTLPMSFHPTLILNQPDLPPKIIALLCNSNHRGVVVPGNKGTVLEIACSKAVFTGINGSSQEWGDQTVRVTLPSAHPDVQPLDDREQEKITNEFQSRFLMYRLDNVHRVRDAAADPPAFAGLGLSCNLLACVPDKPEVAQQVVPLLQSQQQDFIAQRRYDLRSVIVEVLWAKLHTSTKKLTVGRIAELANALLRDRGGNREYSPGEVGWRLHHFRIPRHKERDSNVVQFSHEVSRRVHQLARESGLELPTHPETCPDCAERQTVAE